MRQVMVAHREFLRRVLKGCLLSRRVKLLRALIDLKTLAQRFAAVSARIRAEAAPHGGSSSSSHQGAGAVPATRHTLPALTDRMERSTREPCQELLWHADMCTVPYGLSSRCAVAQVGWQS
jgi:hypothetical protein